MEATWVARVALIGIGATLAMDAWALLLRRALGIPSLDWAMAGRWLGHMQRARFAHRSIAQAAPVRGERAIGWLAHYAVGIAFAAALAALAGLGWLRDPAVLPALGFGLATVAFPFALMQPGMGAGFAAAKTPEPNRVRRRSLLTHAVFGLGLYAAAELAARMLPG